MEEHIPQLSYRAGLGERIEPANGFIYEVTEYISYKKESRIELEENFFLKCSKETKFKFKREIYPLYDRFTEVTLIGAPIKFIIENNLPIFELQHKIKVKNEKGKSDVQSRQVYRCKR